MKNRQPRQLEQNITRTMIKTFIVLALIAGVLSLNYYSHALLSKTSFAVLGGPKITIFNSGIAKYQTLQVKVDAQFSRPLLKNNIWIESGGIKIPFAPNIVKVDDTTYFIYGTILSGGDYTFNVKVNYYQNGKPTISILQQDFKVKQSNYVLYDSLFMSQAGKLEDLAGKVLISSLYKNESFNIYKKQFFDKLSLQQSELNKLNPKNIYFIIKVLDELNENNKLNYDEQLKLQSLKDYVIAKQNNLLGSLTLNITNNLNNIMANCLVDNHQYNISHSMAITIPNNINITNIITCSLINESDGKTIDLYSLGSDLLNLIVNVKKEYHGYAITKNLSYSIANNSIKFYLSGCMYGWGGDEGYGLLTTGNENRCISSTQSTLTELSNYIYINDNKSLDNIYNKQSSMGCFSSLDKTLAIAIELSKFNSSMANVIKHKAVSCLKNNYNNLNLTGEAFYLYYFEKPSKLLAVWPGVIMAESGKPFDITLFNKGKVDVETSLLLKLSNQTVVNQTINIEKGKPKTLTITLPSLNQNGMNHIIYTEFNINYDDTFILPVYLNITPTNIQKPIVISNETNKTFEQITQTPTTETDSLYVNTTQINGVVNESKTISLLLKNKADRTLNISFSYSATLYGLIKPVNVPKQLQPKQQAVLTFMIEKSDQAFNFYQGTITLIASSEAGKSSVDIPININFTQQIVKRKLCSELDGKICGKDETCQGDLVVASDSYACCTGKCKAKVNKKKMTAVGFLMLALAIIIIIAFVLMKKPRKQKITDVVKEIEKKYAKPSLKQERK